MLDTYMCVSRSTPDVRYLYLSAVNVNRQGSFLAAAQQEKMREREALESGLMFSRDRLVEMIPVKAFL